VLVCVGALGIAWSLFAVNGLTEAYELDRISDLITSGQTVPPPSLDPILARFDRRPPLGCSRNVIPLATIRLYAGATAALAKAPDSARLLGAADKQIRDALACSPHQPYLWYGLFWTEMTEGRPAERYIPLLQESYRLGPREGWVSYYRNSDALPLFDKLDKPTQELVRAEYLAMAKDQVAVAAANFKAVDEPTRARLLQWMADLPIEQRRQLASALDAADVVADVPGVEYRKGRAIMDPKRELR
jgi:hypothetical protein